MADNKDWAEADDAQLRRAMATLRADVEATPLPDVRFVKARGMQRRRQRWLVATASAAAAAVVVGSVAFAQLGGGTDRPVVPGDTSTASTPAPTTTGSSLDKPGALPLLEEWTAALGLTGAARLTPVGPFEPVECLQSEPGGKNQQEEITRGPDFQGGQVLYGIGTGQDADTAAEGIATDIAGCQAGPGYEVTPQASSGWPRLYSYTAGAAGSGWWAVVPDDDNVAVLQLGQNDRPTSQFSAQQVLALVAIAQQRLDRYGSAPTSSPTSSPSSTVGPTVTAIDEEMPVSGPDPKPSSTLFVAASQWTSPRFAQGAKAYADAGSPDVSLAIVQCETEEQQAGVAGRVGIVAVRAGSGDANVIGRQRVRVFDDIQGYELVQADMKRIDQLVMKGCASAGGANRTTAERGPVEGTYLLTTKVTAEATGTMYQWVGVTGMQVEGAISTVVFGGTDDGQGFQGSKAEGFAELLRLMDLARQK